MSVIDQLGGGHRKPAGCKEGSGILLMLLGGAVMIGSAVCTVVFTVGFPRDVIEFVFIGSIPFLLGIGVYWLGNSMRKSAQQPTDPADPNDPPPVS